MNLKFIILGCGSSFGVPRIDGDFGDCNPKNKKNIRTRCSALLSCDNLNVIFDTSPDLKAQLLHNKITNIDQEHMNYHNSMNALKELFKRFIEKTPSFGKSFICLDDKNNKAIIKQVKTKNFHTYGTDKKSQFFIFIK